MTPTTPMPAGQALNHCAEPPGRNTSLYKGMFVLQQDNHQVRLRGTLTIAWLPNPGITFQGRTNAKAAPDLNPGPGTIEIPSLHLHAPVLISKQTTTIKKRTNTTYHGSINGQGSQGITPTTNHADTITFHLVNFHSYLGDPITYGTGRIRGRLPLRNHHTTITIDQPLDHDQRANRLRNNGGYAVTHVGTIKASAPLTYAASIEQLTILRYFLAFCCGAWCGPIIPTATAHGLHQWTQWASWQLTSWQQRQSWFPTSDPTVTNHLPTLYDAFTTKWADPLWHDTFTTALHWYIQANAYGHALEARILPAEVALEALAWAYLVEDQHHESVTSFRRKTATQHITQLLTALSIPITIPVTHQHLVQTGAPDAVASIINVRNKLTHPKPHGRPGHDELREATWLCIEYLELVILAILKYQGTYTRRISGVFVTAATVKVPWAP